MTENDMLDNQSLPEKASYKTAETPKQRKRVKWLKILSLLVLFILVLYLLSLILINTAWFRAKVTTQLAKKTGTQWEIESISWVPFGKIYLKGLKTSASQQPDQGEVILHSVVISPTWNHLISGRLLFHNIVVESMDVDAEFAWLKEMMSKSKNSNIPVLETKKNTIEHELPKQTVRKEKKPKQTISDQQKGKAPLAVQPPSQQKKEAKQKEAIAEQVTSSNQTLIIKKLNIKIKNKKQTLFNYENIALTIPLSGKPRNGAINLLPGTSEEQSIPIIWDGRAIAVRQEKINLFGVDVGINLSVFALQKTNLFSLQLVLREQAFCRDFSSSGLNINLESPALQAQFRLNGGLLNPQSWNGSVLLQCKNLKIKEINIPEKIIVFDYVYTVGRVFQGNLIINDATAQSEALTFMANAVVTNNTYSYGVIRCVANPYFSNELNKIHHGTYALHIDHKSYTLFEDLMTPDRLFMDLYLDGKLKHLECRHNRSKRWQSFNQVVATFKSFISEELDEWSALQHISSHEPSSF